MQYEPVPATPGRRLPRVIHDFLNTEAASGIVLLAGALVALVWANSPWDRSYTELWHTRVGITVGDWSIREDLRHWVNDALMAVFFFVVGLEIKRELVRGELRQWRTAALPAFGALGGMLVPALIFLVVNGGGPGHDGWGIPMATDIAFAVGVLALLGSRVPGSLKLFLLTLAIVDDIGAILVIAVFYSSGVNGVALAAAAGGVAAIVVMQRVNVHWIPAYVAAAAVIWLATYESGVHATIAGVVIGLLTPARPLAPTEVAKQWSLVLGHRPTAEELAVMTRLARSTISPADRLEHALHPLASFVIVPIFALANAGVTIRTESFEADGAVAVATGVAAGLLLGKTIGISLFSWLACRVGIGILPPGVRWSQLVGVATVAGIGFTVSLFVSSLAFQDAELESAAKVGILGASLVAAVVGSAVLLALSRHPPAHGPPASVDDAVPAGVSG